MRALRKASTRLSTAARHFKRLTGPDVIVNDVFIDPRDSNHLLLATDRGGVLVSTDAGATFAASNEGISGRKVTALLVDRDNPMRLFAGVVNDKNYGGAFVSTDGGAAWQQIGSRPGWARRLRTGADKGWNGAGRDQSRDFCVGSARRFRSSSRNAELRVNLGGAEHDCEHHYEGIHRDCSQDTRQRGEGE